MIARLQLRSQRAFVHAMSSNAGAIRLSEELGFRVSQTTTFAVVTREPL